MTSFTWWRSSRKSQSSILWLVRLHPNRGKLWSFLIEITALVLRQRPYNPFMTPSNWSDCEEGPGKTAVHDAIPFSSHDRP